MKPTPLLDFWQKPKEAGEPVAVLATTYALEPDFFERNCLARFLEVSSVDEDTGSVDDVVASVELHELLQKVVVTILADRSAPVERSSLLWDLLSCHVDGGLLHAKVTVLVWEKATRVILGSANLTEAGYRRQIELGLAADLGPDCLLPADVLAAIARELESYVALTPGYDATVEVFGRALQTIDVFRKRIAEMPGQRSPVRVAFAPTNGNGGPLAHLRHVWHGPQPLVATHLSPFWDSHDREALSAVRKLISGRPVESRSQRVALAIGRQGQVSFSAHLAGYVDDVRELKPLDQELRLLHAKCLLIESSQWVAALIGSSNHTKAGLGLSAARHREMNVWLGAPRGSKAGKELLELVQLGGKVRPDAAVVEPKDEDEDPRPALPVCFGLCRVMRRNDSAPWELQLGIAAEGMPADWMISLGDEPILRRQQWAADGKPETISVPLDQMSLPMYVVVEWDGCAVPWAVVADDRLALPPGPGLASLRAQHLLDALARGRTLGEVIRDELLHEQTEGEHQGGMNLDPLRRLEIKDSLLRRGRALAASLSAMQRRLERPVVTLDALRARLAGPLGPEFVAMKVVEASESGEQSQADAVFTVGEIALSVGRVAWRSIVLEHVDAPEAGLELVNETLDRIDALKHRVGGEPADLVAYTTRAIEEARRCLLN